MKDKDDYDIVQDVTNLIDCICILVNREGTYGSDIVDRSDSEAKRIIAEIASEYGFSEEAISETLNGQHV